ncbi:MAG TPA: hypothetical protein VG963_04055 [Polyangiaceae bacterium]|nr:hypothetical protein [Polyangiaceae bacterium]
MDGDIFSKVTKLGAGAADALLRAAEGGPWDPFCARRALDVLVSAADGIQSVPMVLEALRKLSSAPLLATAVREHACREIASARLNAPSTLDLILQKLAQSCILRGEYDPRTVLERFSERLLDRTVVSARGGLGERASTGVVEFSRELLRPIARDAADVLVARPTAKRLGLARRLSKLAPDSNLLGDD